LNAEVLSEGFCDAYGFSEAYKRKLGRRVSLNRAILKNPYWFLPVDDKGHQDFMPVGRGAKSSHLCGQWRSLVVCKNKEGHKGKFLNGVDCSGKVVVRHKHWWCHKATCPICFARGWSVRQARSVDSRVETGVKRGFGKVEHCMVSVAVAHRGLPEFVMRKRCRDALKDRGVVGGGMIFHGFRVDRERNCLVWSPHYHVLGFIEGGFDRCRDCVHVREDCAVCDGFKGRETRGYAKDKYLVKVLPERKTVFGTAWYQLNHATIRVGLKRFHAVTWYGCCSNRMYSSAKFISKAEDVCPVCSGEMVKCFHAGKRFIVKNVGHVGYEACFVDDEFDEDGEANYPEVYGSRGFG
jgi:hypothetical protein